MGCSLSPAFSVEIRDPSSGMFVLKYDQLVGCHQSDLSKELPALSTMHRRLRDFQHIVTMLRENVVGAVEEDWDEEEVDDFEESYAL